MIQILGYVAMVCLVISALPQVIKTVRDGHANGIAGGFLVLILVGFSSMFTYLWLTKPIVPVMINYGANMILWLTVCFYKVYPRHEKSK